MRSPRLRRAVLLTLGCIAPCLTSYGGGSPAFAQQRNARVSGDLLHPRRIAALPPEPRREWLRYLEISRQQDELDRAAVQAELRAMGRAEWTPAREGPNYVIDDRMTEAWFRTAEARRMAEIILSFQAPSGGWSKRLDLRTRPRQPGEGYTVDGGWTFVATFDNDATTEHLRFLARAHAAHPSPRFREAFLRGMEYVFRAQFPNGCWPQAYPLKGGYHDAATYNDDVMVRVLRLLDEVARGEHEWVPADVRREARRRAGQGVECVLASQVVVDGRRTVWGAQHDPLTLQPVAARSYEHASLSGGESAAVVAYLLDLPSPGPRVVEAVEAAVAWFRETAIYGYHYQSKAGLVAREGAGPIWARFYEIGTNRPIFSNRDGIVRYDWHELEAERRHGYAWYRSDAAAVLKSYSEWARRHSRRDAPSSYVPPVYLP